MKCSPVVVTISAALTVHEASADLGNHVSLGALFRTRAVQLAHFGAGANHSPSLSKATISHFQLGQIPHQGF